jgi:hypothetical protein
VLFVPEGMPALQFAAALQRPLLAAVVFQREFPLEPCGQH